MGCTAKANVLLVGGGGTGGYIVSTYNHGGGGSGYINYGTVSIPYSVGFHIEIGQGGVPGQITSNYSPLAGQPTSISNETGTVLLTAQGGKEGDKWTGGDGYSGGGGDKADGGMNGGNGGSSSSYSGGIGSGFNISSVQHLFGHLRLLPAKGNPGCPKGSSDFGGGGGGIQVEEVDAVHLYTYGPYGQGGDGYKGSSQGLQGVILMEIK